MITVSEAVENYIHQSPYLLEAITDDIINYTALARKIKDEIEEELHKDIQVGAIVMALKRLKPKLNRLNIQDEVLSYVNKMGEIIVRSDLIDFTFKNSVTLIQKQQKLLREIENMKDIFHASSKGVYETNIVSSKKIEDIVENIFGSEELLHKTEKLGAITMRLPADNITVPGIYYYILKKIAWEGINISEVVSTTNEFTLIIDQKDVNRTFSLLHNMTQQ
ncbi:aspartate kinase [Sediminitomix flava]|uniref:Aspartate kinase n=1 Tax=Sediminitomix flava TaxID=379075 RepID=A0A315ZAH4_SEDFL|nr:aspartate kinase [Sediminitomix flava]PWJ42541.1 hypothetical protein BC781_10284 [Sediminitomix flava]